MPGIELALHDYARSSHFPKVPFRWTDMVQTVHFILIRTITRREAVGKRNLNALHADCMLISRRFGVAHFFSFASLVLCVSWELTIHQRLR